MRFFSIPITVLVLLGATVAGAAETPLMSKTYKFKSGVALEIGAAMEDGVRLDTVRFRLPDEGGGLPFRLGAGVRAEVAVSNLGSSPCKVGVAIALFDAEGRLLGVASGGSSLMAIKPERTSTYNLSFKDVNNRVAEAVSFQISVERK